MIGSSREADRARVMDEEPRGDPAERVADDPAVHRRLRSAAQTALPHQSGEA